MLLSMEGTFIVLKQQSRIKALRLVPRLIAALSIFSSSFDLILIVIAIVLGISDSCIVFRVIVD